MRQIPNSDVKTIDGDKALIAGKTGGILVSLAENLKILGKASLMDEMAHPDTSNVYPKMLFQVGIVYNCFYNGPPFSQLST